MSSLKDDLPLQIELNFPPCGGSILPSIYEYSSSRTTGVPLSRNTDIQNSLEKQDSYARSVKPSPQSGKVGLPTGSAERKAVPLWTGLVKYFPLALAEVAKVSQAGGDQHNPGKPLFWDRPKSGDHHDCLLRHLFESGTLDSDGQRHSAKVVWRALAILQLELEASK